MGLCTLNHYTSGVSTRVMVTGANGFVGQVTCETLQRAGFDIRAAIREANRTPLHCPGEIVTVGFIGPNTDWESALDGVDSVVHLAGRVHVLRETLRDPQAEFHRVNALGTEHLACAAAHAGVRRLVYVSSIGVNGRATPGFTFGEEHTPSPHNSYAISKWEAEQALHEVARTTRLEVVVLRPPLIYGPGVKANFLKLMELVNRRIPLPLGAIKNRRSLLYVGNLSDVIVKCIEAPEAAGETFLVSDGHDVSTPGLIRLIGEALDNMPVLLPVPASAMRIVGRMTGTLSAIEPLLDSLTVNSTKVRRTLGWQPPYTMAQGMRETAAWFKDGRAQAGKDR